MFHDFNIANQYFQAFAYLYQFSGGVLGVKQSEFGNNLVVYPNPCNGVLNIDAGGNTALTDVKNQVGKMVIEVSEKILRRELENKDSQEKYIKDLTSEIKLN